MYKRQVYTDDIAPKDCLIVKVLRSPHAHAWIEEIEDVYKRQEVVQTAQNQPMTEEKLLKQIQKTGGSPFYFEELTGQAEGSCFLPVQALNGLRRAGLEQLEEAIRLCEVHLKMCIRDRRRYVEGAGSQPGGNGKRAFSGRDCSDQGSCGY